MPLRLRLLLGILFLTIATSGFYRFGGSIWRPIFSSIRGESTVLGTLKKLELRGRGLTKAEQESTTSITLLALKKERSLEVWRHTEKAPPERIRTFAFTGFSGEIGPKLREGDGQIPEGIYGIEYLNPNSSYHLSIKLTYPNAFDRKKAKQDGREYPGTDIFIHGKSATIGCIPVGDENIEHLFAIVAQVGKKQTKAIVAPADFRIDPSFPEVDSVSWESELYSAILEEFMILAPPPLKP